MTWQQQAALGPAGIPRRGWPEGGQACQTVGGRRELAPRSLPRVTAAARRSSAPLALSSDMAIRPTLPRVNLGVIRGVRAWAGSIIVSRGRARRCSPMATVQLVIFSAFFGRARVS